MIRCLLVAGDKEARDIVKVGLEQTAAFEVETAEDAWAFEMVKARPYQVVVADATLADGGDGVELLRRIREALPQAELLLIARPQGAAKPTATDRIKDKKEFDVYASISYPIDAGAFFRTIARLMERLQTGGRAPTATAAAAA
jgi:DNA-binding NtrC family response regulator